MNSGYTLDAALGDFGFTLAPGASTGIFAYCQTAGVDFRFGYRSAATTGAPISDDHVTLTHLVRSSGGFNTDNAVRGFYGNVYYHTETFGFWTRDNTTNVTGANNSPFLVSSLPPFPISGALVNTTTEVQTTNYAITSYDVNGVKETTTAAVTVKAPLLNTVIQEGNNLTANQDGTYQWFDCSSGSNVIIDGAVSQTFIPTVSGSYGVTVTFDGCSINSDCLAVVLGNTKFDDRSFMVYPNPNQGSFKINSSFDGHISMINQLGQIVKKFSVKTGIEQNFQVDLAQGVYYLNGKTDNGNSILKKIIITK
jgi:hypothetical protein